MFSRWASAIPRNSGAVFLPNETRTELGSDRALVFGDFPGTGAFIRAGRKPYFLAKEWDGCYDPDPYEYIAAQEKNARWEAQENLFG